MSRPPRLQPATGRRGFSIPPQQLALGAVLLVEVVVFASIGTNFFTWANFFEIPRLNVEMGLLALALTLVIVTGGIDLSVGSLMGLSAIVFGKLMRDAGLPPALAAAATLALGILAGSLNALLITRLRIPPLIVTLGSLSLFRGLAEGITRGVDNFTNLPPSVIFWGQGYIGPIPAQLPLLVLAIAIFWTMLHRGRIGRELSAIGFAPEGARYAGIRVERRLASVYILSGLCASLAALIYVARVGQAKADAGMNYELSAITAVVLGGTSIFGGYGSILGTMLGLFAIAVLQNGLRLADMPPELAGILTGVLLVLGIATDRRTRPARATQPVISEQNKEFSMRNSQLAALCIVIVLAAFIIAGSNYMLVRSAQQSNPRAQAPQPVPGKRLTIAMMPKSKGNAYFITCRKGAEEAARELGVDLIWDGPTDTDPAKQNEIVETWLTRGVDAIAVSVENRDGLSTVLRKARDRGVKVITWDADAAADARDFFVNQATPQGIGYALMDNAAQAMGGKGEFAVITASLTAANQNEWLKYVDARLQEKYPDIKRVDLRPCDDLQKKAFDEANTILTAHPNVKLIMAICSPAVPGAAEAVKQSGRTDVAVIGLGLPNDNKPYVHAGITKGVVLWNTMDLGYLAVYAAKAAADGSLKPADTQFAAGRLGSKEIRDRNVLLGTPFTFDKTNIDSFDF